MAKYDFTNAKPFKELTLTESDNIAYEQGYHDAIEKAKAWLKAYDITFTETPSMMEDFCKAMER